ncbi:MAG: AGCS family alanine or glycine:cation symporter [Alteromonas naphthalenivorans]|jgi:AGCS family alanine or glycine:cation symporter
MSDSFFSCLELIDDSFWNYAGVPVLLTLGFYLSVKAKFMQVTHFRKITNIFFSFLDKKEKKKTTERGIPGIKAFFAAVGGCIGVANLVSVCSAVQIGGPGAVFWMWIAAFLGMIVKYAEIYVGMKYRVKNNTGGYDGGPMYFLQHATSNPWIPKFVCILLCIYGVDMYIFRIVTHSFVASWNWDPYLVTAFLLIAVLFGGERGIKRVGDISSVIVPIFLLAFIGCSSWIFLTHWHLIPGVFADIFYSAFTPRAAIGAFTGASLMTTISYGMKRACYTGDIGIGYASIIHSESAEKDPARQAALGIFGIFLDTFVVCTMSVLLILVTGAWHQGINEELIVPHVMSQYIPGVDIIWPLFVFMLGYSTLLAIFASGKKAAKFLHPKYGPGLYNAYAIVMFLIFSFVGTNEQIMIPMSLIGGLLLVINVWGLFKLRKSISYKLSK